MLEISKQVPVVLIDDGVEGSNIPSIRVDNVAACRQATLHLVKRGHRRIAYLGGSTASIVGRERIGGYVQALVESGIQADPRRLATSGRPDLRIRCTSPVSRL